MTVDRQQATMLIFLIFGIFFFPKITADEIQINQDGSVHWLRDWKEVVIENKLELEAVNSEMKYKIYSPLSTKIGSLEKGTTIEGCQHIGGCKIILRFGDGTIFHEEPIETGIYRIRIDLGRTEAEREKIF